MLFYALASYFCILLMFLCLSVLCLITGQKPKTTRRMIGNAFIWPATLTRAVWRCIKEAWKS